MASQPPVSDVKRAKPQLNVYTSLLVIAFLLGVLGIVALVLDNSNASGQGPFDIATGR